MRTDAPSTPPAGRTRSGAAQGALVAAALVAGACGIWFTGDADSWTWAHLAPWLAERGNGPRALLGAAVGVGAGLPLLAAALPRIGRLLVAPLLVYAVCCWVYWLGTWALTGHGETCDQPQNWAQCDYAGTAVGYTTTSAAGFAAAALTAVLLRRRQRRRSGRLAG